MADVDLQEQAAAALLARGGEFYAARPYAYLGRRVERDQLFTLTGSDNDVLILRTRLAKPFTGQAETCATCGARFRHSVGLRLHYTAHHAAEGVSA